MDVIAIRPRRKAVAPLRQAVLLLAIGSVSSLLGALLADDPTVTAVLGGVVLTAAVIILIPRLAPLVIFATPLVTAQISGIGGIAALFVCVVIFGIRTRSLLHPFVIYGSIISLYLLIGGANISTYRGEISSATLRFILLYVLTLLLGTAITGGTMHRVRAHESRLSLSRSLLVLGFIPGMIGTLLIVQKAGIVILHPNSRTVLSGATLLLAEMLLAGLALYCCHVFSQRAPRRVDWGIIALTLLGLANSGYRGWPIMGIILVASSGVYFGRLRVTIWRVIGLATLCIVIIAGGSFIRRDTALGNTTGELTTQQLAARYNAQAIPAGVRELHFAFREAIGITQILIQDRRMGRRIHGSLLLADFETLLPGKQPSGGQLIGQVVGIQGDAGLTGGAVGVSFMDIGYYSLLLFFVLGLGIGWAWRMASRAPYWALFYFLTIIYAIQFFHRGVPKPSYAIIPLFFLFVSSLARLSSHELSTQASAPPCRSL